MPMRYMPILLMIWVFHVQYEKQETESQAITTSKNSRSIFSLGQKKPSVSRDYPTQLGLSNHHVTHCEINQQCLLVQSEVIRQLTQLNKINRHHAYGIKISYRLCFHQVRREAQVLCWSRNNYRSCRSSSQGSQSCSKRIPIFMQKQKKIVSI